MDTFFFFFFETVRSLNSSSARFSLCSRTGKQRHTDRPTLATYVSFAAQTSAEKAGVTLPNVLKAPQMPTSIESGSKWSLWLITASIRNEMQCWRHFVCDMLSKNYVFVSQQESTFLEFPIDDRWGTSYETEHSQAKNSLFLIFLKSLYVGSNFNSDRGEMRVYMATKTVTARVKICLGWFQILKNFHHQDFQQCFEIMEPNRSLIIILGENIASQNSRSLDFFFFFFFLWECSQYPDRVEFKKKKSLNVHFHSKFRDILGFLTKWCQFYSTGDLLENSREIKV
jgi:hypothetical protein